MEYIIKDNRGQELFSVEGVSRNDPNRNKYIFIRLYDPVYGAFAITNLLKKCINMTQVNAVKSSHASIGFNLKDSFYGLTYDMKTKDGSLKLESCTNPSDNAFMKSCKPDKSKYYVYALPVNISEYDKAKSITLKAFNDNTVVYGISKNFSFAIPAIKRKILDKRLDGSRIQHDAKEYGSESSNSKNKEELTEEEKLKIKRHKYCCSTFVSAVLAKAVPKVYSFFYNHGNDSDDVQPSDLTVIPGMVKLFSGFYKDYKKDAKKFVNKYPEFKQYL